MTVLRNWICSRENSQPRWPARLSAPRQRPPAVPRPACPVARATSGSILMKIARSRRASACSSSSTCARSGAFCQSSSGPLGAYSTRSTRRPVRRSTWAAAGPCVLSQLSRRGLPAITGLELAPGPALQHVARVAALIFHCPSLLRIRTPGCAPAAGRQTTGYGSSQRPLLGRSSVAAPASGMPGRRHTAPDCTHGPRRPPCAPVGPPNPRLKR